MIEQLPTNSERVLAFRMSGKLHDEDYKTFIPAVEAAAARHGKVRLLADFQDFHGWDAHALWDDIMAAPELCLNMERIALVGDRKWEVWMAKVCRLFTMAKTKYFDVSEIGAARAWLDAP
jgi:hypothetical protein